MSLRPVSTRWFEVLAPRVECARTLGTLARTGAVEVEVRPHRDEALSVQELAAGLGAYRELAKRYWTYWARGELRHAPAPKPPRVVLEHALQRIDDWRHEADPLIARLQELEEERSRLQYCRRFLSALRGRPLRFDTLARAGPVLSVISAIVPRDAELALPDPLIVLGADVGEETCMLVAVPRGHTRAVQEAVQERNGHLIERPPWLAGDAAHALSQVVERLRRLDAGIVEHYAQLDALYEDAGLPDALGDVACLEWFLEEVGSLEPATVHFAWVTGWTSDLTGESLSRGLADAGVPALVRFGPPPPGARAPQLLRNPWWSRPFEVFARAFGTPDASEVDPSPLLAAVVPLLFGYMFADVGQGLVLLAAGLWLRPRWSAAGLLIAGGASAAVFGVLFGSLFSREDLIPALVLHPLDDPLLVLVLPIGFGAGLLVLGQTLDALEAVWRGEGRDWLLRQAGLLVLYLGALASLVHPGFQPLALAGALWHIVGRALAERRPSAALGALGSLAEDGLRLLVNTVSFARVGAFALAHAGLSAALMTLADGTGSIAWAVIIMIAGNLLVILLEGLVVSVQTTRLVLFEFFMRFLHGEGRPFRPLPPPPEIVRGRFS